MTFTAPTPDGPGRSQASPGFAGVPATPTGPPLGATSPGSPLIGPGGPTNGSPPNGRPPAPTPSGSTPPAGKKKAGKDNWKRSAIEWALVIVGALAIAFTLRATSFQVFYIPSGSMEPTLQVGDRVVVNQWSYRLHDVNRGDIVVFGRPEGENAVGVKDLIKRVIGLPGETVTITDNHVLINGVPLDEPYLPPGTKTDGTGTPVPCDPAHPCHIPDGQVWVMGDNRTNSSDSRFFGPIPESKIVGRAFVRLWPLGRLGGL